MEFDRKKIELRQSKGNGTVQHPFTYNENYVNPDKNKIIEEGAVLSIDRVMNGEKVYFTFETGTFLIMYVLSNRPLFIAIPEIHGSKQELNWPTYASSVFTLEAVKRYLKD
ncbi:MAG TPA: hypothetical protein VLE44_00100 [Candidatus Saccharimonadales bacterium]|nr:hypothetical protein [Candidatus Saccharimonadales bacterium]